MASNNITPTLIDQMASSDANNIGQFLAWLERRIYQWTTNCGTAAEMTALGYSTAASHTVASTGPRCPYGFSYPAQLIDDGI